MLKLIREYEDDLQIAPLDEKYLTTTAEQENYLDWLKSGFSGIPAWCFGE